MSSFPYPSPAALRSSACRAIAARGSDLPSSDTFVRAASPKTSDFASCYSLGRFTMRNSAERVSDQVRTSSNPNRRTMPAPEVYRPTRSSSLQPLPAGKMIARGGNERAPPIVLPPCPYSSEQDFDQRGSTRPNTQRAPKSYMPTGAPRQSGKLHRRQRSLSADDIMAAVS